MQKDIAFEDILTSARLCQKHDIRTLFSFMIGIPEESRGDRHQTYNLMDTLRTIGRGAVINGPLNYYPFPGTALYELAVEKGFKPPLKTERWNFPLLSIYLPRAPYADIGKKFVEHYRRLAWKEELQTIKFPNLFKLIKLIARYRWEKRYFRFPVDYYVLSSLIRVENLRTQYVGRKDT